MHGHRPRPSRWRRFVARLKRRINLLISTQISKQAQAPPDVAALLPAADDSTDILALCWPSQELLERISTCEQQYHLAMRFWNLPQLRLPRYWSRRQLWDILEELTHILAELDSVKRSMDEAVKQISDIPLPTNVKLFALDASVRLPGSFPSERPLCDILLNEETAAVQPRVSVNKFLSTYYVALCELRDSVNAWKKTFQEIASAV